MDKDERYQTVLDMIQKGRVAMFSQIERYIPKTIVARDLPTNNDRITRLLEHPEQFRLEEIYRISKLIDTDHLTIIGLIDKQIESQTMPKSNT
jgi:hypothetical protein